MHIVWFERAKKTNCTKSGLLILVLSKFLCENCYLGVILLVHTSIARMISFWYEITSPVSEKHTQDFSLLDWKIQLSGRSSD